MEKQREKILAAMRKEPERIWFVKEFQGGENFVGYEAGTRIGDLVRLGLVEKVKVPGKFMGYRFVKDPKPTLPEIVAKAYTVAIKDMLKKAFIAGRSSGWSVMSHQELAEEYVSNLK